MWRLHSERPKCYSSLFWTVSLQIMSKVLEIIFYKINFEFILRFDGNTFNKLDIDSNYGHVYSYFSTYKSKPLIIGGEDSSGGIGYHTKMESLENGGTAEQRWIQSSDYPYGSQ